MTLKEVLILAAAGYTKADIDALSAPAAPSVPQTPAAPQVQDTATRADSTAQAAPTMADVMQAITNLSARITPAPTFQQTPAPRGVDDIINGFLGDGVKGGVNNG